LGSTPYYDPPEVREKKSSKEELQHIFRPCVDVYAFGLILAELFFDITPKTIDYKTTMAKSEQKMKVLEKVGENIKILGNTLSGFYARKLTEILDNCLSPEPSNRRPISDIKSRLQYLLAHYQTTLS